MRFYRHPIYFFTHLILGFLGYLYPEILYGTLGYQLFQYFFNVRIFIFEMTLKQGNSLEHTSVKLSEVFIGYLIAMLCKALNII
jgi:hypothetical protein